MRYSDILRSRSHRIKESTIWRLLPGLRVATSAALAALLLSGMFKNMVVSPLILSIVIGTVFHYVFRTPAIAKPGPGFCMKRLLRAGIVSLGLQVTLQQVAAVGAPGIALILCALVATFLFTTWLGSALGVDAKHTQLVAAGCSIYGASAAVATDTVTGARDEHVAYAVTCVTVFGSLSMVLMHCLLVWSVWYRACSGRGPEPRFTRSRRLSPRPIPTVPKPGNMERSPS